MQTEHHTVSGNLNTGIPAGYVSCIAIDPQNSNKVLAVLSNYNIRSLWYSDNGGTTWTNVEGNLAGANGPSVRWAEIFYVSSVMHIMLATSTGMYSTISIKRCRYSLDSASSKHNRKRSLCSD